MQDIPSLHFPHMVCLPDAMLVHGHTHVGTTHTWVPHTCSYQLLPFFRAPGLGHNPLSVMLCFGEELSFVCFVQKEKCGAEGKHPETSGSWKKLLEHALHVPSSSMVFSSIDF